MSNHRRPLVVATTVLVLGVAASLAGNLQAINLDNAQPGVGAYISATAWPLALFGVVELLIHTPWLASWRDGITKVAVLILVGSTAAWISYWHLANVLSHYGYDVASRYAGPVAIDAAMVLAALALDRVVQARRVQPMDNGSDQAVDIALDNPAGQWTVPVASVQDVAESEAAFAGQLDNAELTSAAKDADRAAGQLGQELASETESWLAGLSSRVQDTTTTPAVPVVQGPVQPRTRRVSSRVVIDPIEGAALARIGKDNGLLAKDIAELLAGHFGTSDKTIRRQDWWLPSMNPERG